MQCENYPEDEYTSVWFISNSGNCVKGREKKHDICSRLMSDAQLETIIMGGLFWHFNVFFFIKTSRKYISFSWPWFGVTMKLVTPTELSQLLHANYRHSLATNVWIYFPDVLNKYFQQLVQQPYTYLKFVFLTVEGRLDIFCTDFEYLIQYSNWINDKHRLWANRGTY